MAIAPLAESQLRATVDVLARAFCGNPLNRAVVRSEAPGRRLRSLQRGMRALLEAAQDHGRVLVGCRDGAVVAGLIATPPERFPLPPPPAMDQLRFLLRAGWSISRRWRIVFEHLDAFHPDEPHWYLGVLGVDCSAQRRGVGSALLSHWLHGVDRDAMPAYLETDGVDNIRFYERAGFSLAGETSVFGVRIWLMKRPPARCPRNT